MEKKDFDEFMSILEENNCEVRDKENSEIIDDDWLFEKMVEND